MQDLQILGIQFGDGVAEITYSESRNQNDHCAVINQMILQTAEFGESLAVILEEVRDMVDAGLLILRDPPESYSPRDRVRAAAARRDDEDWVKMDKIGGRNPVDD